MSVTMVLGRVVLPAAAVLLAGVLVWHSVRSLTARAGPGSGRTEALPSDWPPVTTVRLPGGIIAEGRVVAHPGAEVTVGSEVLGTITGMPAPEGAAVRKGDLLVELRADDVRASLREARARQ